MHNLLKLLRHFNASRWEARDAFSPGAVFITWLSMSEEICRSPSEGLSMISCSFGASKVIVSLLMWTFSWKGTAPPSPSYSHHFSHRPCSIVDSPTDEDASVGSYAFLKQCRTTCSTSSHEKRTIYIAAISVMLNCWLVLNTVIYSWTSRLRYLHLRRLIMSASIHGCAAAVLLRVGKYNWTVLSHWMEQCDEQLSSRRAILWPFNAIVLSKLRTLSSKMPTSMDISGPCILLEFLPPSNT